MKDAKNNYLSLTGEVVFNKLLTPDEYLGNKRYTLTINLDKDGKMGNIGFPKAY